MILSLQLEKIRSLLRDISSLCEADLERAVRTAATLDSNLAREVLTEDDRIGPAEAKLREECLLALALYQPVASDLRYIMAVSKIANDLRRIGDLSRQIASTTLLIALRADGAKPPFDMNGMGQMVREMLHQTIQALSDLDPDRANAVQRQDAAVDALHRTLYDAVQQTLYGNSGLAASAMDYVGLSRQFERIADHTSYIARDVGLIVNSDPLATALKPMPGIEPPQPQIPTRPAQAPANFSLKFSSILERECVQNPIAAASKQEVLDGLIGLVAGRYGMNDVANMRAAIWQRENTRPTGIGLGIAVPHGKVPGLQGIHMAVGRVASPIEYGSLDRKPVDLIFLLVSGPDQTAAHIKVLAKLSRMLTDENMRNALRAAVGPDALFELLTKHDADAL